MARQYIQNLPDGVFYGAEAITSVDLSLSSFSGIKSIGNEAFMNSGLKNITFGSNVESIGDDAFRGCTGLTSAWSGQGVPEGSPPLVQVLLEERVSEYIFGGTNTEYWRWMFCRMRKAPGGEHS